MTLHDNGTGVDFKVDLRSDLNFVNTGNHSVFSFNANSVAAGDISNIRFNGNMVAGYAGAAPGTNPPSATDTFTLDGRLPGCDNGAALSNPTR